MNIKMIKNSGYSWIEEHGVNFKGYFLWNGELYREQKAVQAFQKLASYSDFVSFVSQLNGCFAVVVEKGNTAFAAVDRACSIPLFFSRDGKFISDSSEHIREKMGIAKENVSLPHLAEFIAKTYLVLNDTVYEQIAQLNLGQSLYVDDTRVSASYYYRHIQNIVNTTREAAKLKATEIITRIFENIKKIVGERPVILSLSGGYDSRLIACMLKEAGFENVLCYSYGNSKSYETVLSKQIAQSLNYQWHFTEYSKEKILALLSDEQTEAYRQMYGEHIYTIYLQNFSAVQELSQKGMIPKNAVFLTGLCGDMPSGVYVPSPEQLERVSFSREYLAKAFYESKLTFYQPIPEVADHFIRELEQDIPDTPIKTSQDYVSVLDCLEVSAPHIRCFIKMNNAHEFFGGEWLMPLWDNEWLDFWYSLPMDMRYKQNLYEDWLMESIFAKYDLVARKKDVAAIKTIVNYKPWDIRKKQTKTKLKYFLWAILNRAAFAIGIPIRHPFDVNNFSLLNVNYYQQIKNKRLINWMRLTPVILDCIRICEQRYGKETLKKVRAYITGVNRLL